MAPIRADMRARYPADWKARSRFVRHYRARNRCEWCNAANGEPHPATGSRVVLTVAHVYSKAPEDAHLLNLAALCQRCHNRHDAGDRQAARRERLAKRRRDAGQLPLLLDLYTDDAHAGECYALELDGAPALVRLSAPPDADTIRALDAVARAARARFGEGER